MYLSKKLDRQKYVEYKRDKTSENFKFTLDRTSLEKEKLSLYGLNLNMG